MMTSETARFMPLAPVGGTICAASPARNSRPERIGSDTKERSGAMFFSNEGPRVRFRSNIPLGAATAALGVRDHAPRPRCFAVLFGT
jgi:hypothetical protein